MGSENSQPSQGRFPANIILDEEAGKILDEQSGIVNPQVVEVETKKELVKMEYMVNTQEK